MLSAVFAAPLIRFNAVGLNPQFGSLFNASKKLSVVEYNSPDVNPLVNPFDMLWPDMAALTPPMNALFKLAVAALDTITAVSIGKSNFSIRPTVKSEPRSLAVWPMA